MDKPDQTDPAAYLKALAVLENQLMTRQQSQETPVRPVDVYGAVIKLLGVPVHRWNKEPPGLSLLESRLRTICDEIFACTRGYD
jgi:hypothetical protein